MQTPNDMVLFYHKRTPKALLQRYGGAECICADRIEPEMLTARRDQQLLLVLPNAQIARASAACRQVGCRNVSVLVLDNGYETAPIRIDASKPRLDYMETELTRVCNLHCRCCCDFIQLAKDDRPFYDLHAYMRDLEQLKSFFWGVENIRLMGGEPLLLKNIAEYAEYTRKLFPDCDLRIVTNGLLIPQISKETLARLKKCGCTFDISNYPPTTKHKKEIAAVLRRTEISFDFGIPIRYFAKTILNRPNDNPKPAFDNCLFTHCHMLCEGGWLAPCSYACCIRRFNRHFGTDYPETDGFDLYGTKLDGWQILDQFSKPHLFCAYCTRGWVPIRWKDGVHAEQSAVQDWIVPKNALTNQFVPCVQRMINPAARTMRRFIQRKKG